ncbi:MAG TPA: universal stress protein [Solirubrobacterales bacterium]
MDAKIESWEPRRMLVGYDGSAGAKDAVALAKLLCAGTAASVLLVNVLPAGPLPVAYRLLGYEEAPAWKTFFADAEAALDGIPTEHRTYVGGSPAEVLNDLTEKGDIDLVVVGSPHRGMIGRAVMGSVAEALLHGATVTVVAAPRGYADRTHSSFARILVGYDGSTEAGEALATGAAIAAHDGRELRVVCVTTLAKATPGAFGGVVPPDVPDASKLVAEGIAAVGDAADVHGSALRGEPATALAAFAGPEDLLLVGSRSYGPVARTLLGSVSSALIHDAPCPVLVIPRPR